MKKIFQRMLKISLLNYIVIVIVLCVIIFTTLGFSRKQETIYVDLAAYPLEYREDLLPPSFIETDSLTVGDAVYNSLGQKTLEITNVERSSWKGNRKFFLLTAKVQAVYDPRTHQYTYFNTPLLIGGKLTFNTEKSFFTGQIVNVYHDSDDKFRVYTKKEASVTVRMRLLDAAYAEALRNFEAKNSVGDIIAQTLDIKIAPAEIDVETDSGVVYKGFSTFKKDVLITLKLANVYCSDQTCYFNDYQPLKIGSPFWVGSDTVVLDNGLIIDFSLYEQPSL